MCWLPIRSSRTIKWVYPGQGIVLNSPCLRAIRHSPRSQRTPRTAEEPEVRPGSAWFNSGFSPDCRYRANMTDSAPPRLFPSGADAVRADLYLSMKNCSYSIVVLIVVIVIVIVVPTGSD